jgi:group I intron endonuclease
MTQNSNLLNFRGLTVPVERIFINLETPETLTLIRKELKSKPCIYAFHLNSSEDCYVGSSVEPEVRFKNHLFGIDSNKHLQSAFRKYGRNNFTLYILKWVEFPKDLSKRGKADILISAEQSYMDLLKPSYNFSQVAGWSRLGVLHTEESRKKMSLNCKGKNSGKEPINKGKILTEAEKQKSILASKHRYKPVYFYDPGDYHLVAVYESLNASCRAEKANKTSFLRCVVEKRHFRGWLVTYTERTV